MRGWRALALVLALVGSSLPQVALAQGPVDTAREEFERGVEAYKNGQLQAATSAFERSYELAPNPFVLFNVGKANMDAGNDVRARAAFERYLSEASDLKAERVTEVRAALAILATKTAELHLQLRPEQVTASLRLDGEPIGLRALTTPGEHTLEASAEGYEPVRQNVTVVGGQTLTVPIELSALRAEPATSAPTTLTPPPSEPLPNRDQKRSLAPAIVGWSVTGALLAGTVVTTILWSQERSALNDLKQQPTTREELNAQSSKTNTLGAVTLGLGGATVLAAGVATFFTLRRPRASTTAAHWTPVLGLGYAGAHLSF